MEGRDWLAARFEAERPRLAALAYRMLGSRADGEDAVQEAWLRLDRAGGGGIDNLAGWLTTVVARVCLDRLRARGARHEEAVIEPLVTLADEPGPEQQALLADAVGLALLVVLETLEPAERLAFVLHDMFAVPFDEIGPIVGRSPVAARQLASRARRRVQAQSPPVDRDLRGQRRVVDAFLAAARAGDLEGLVGVLAPDVVFRPHAGADAARARPAVVGAEAVARQLLERGAIFAPLARPAVVNGAAGLVVGSPEHPLAVLGMTVSGGRVAAIDLVLDREQLAALAIER